MNYPSILILNACDIKFDISVARFSTRKMCNKRLLAYSPFALADWCAGPCCSYSSGNVLKIKYQA